MEERIPIYVIYDTENEEIKPESALVTILKGEYRDGELQRLVSCLSDEQKNELLYALYCNECLSKLIFKSTHELSIKDMRYVVSRFKLNADILESLLNSR